MDANGEAEDPAAPATPGPMALRLPRGSVRRVYDERAR